MEQTQKDNSKYTWLKKIGLAGFLFFLAKGILWLVLFALLAFGFLDETTAEKIKNFFVF